MYVTMTSDKTSPQRTPRVEAFLGEFLPRLRRFQGVRAIHHFPRPDHGDDMTIIIWDSEDAVGVYRTSDLIKEAAAFEKRQRTQVAREACPLAITLL